MFKIILIIFLIPQLVLAQQATLEEILNRESLFIDGKVVNIKVPKDVYKEEYRAPLTIQPSKLEKSIFIPLPLDDKELVTLVVAGAAGVIVFNNDNDLMDLVQNNKGNAQDAVALLGKYWGWGAPNILGSIGAYYVGGIYENNKLKEFGILLMASTMIAETISFSLKMAVKRERPYINDDPYNTGPSALTDGSSYQSFPSGHAVAAMSFATLVSLHYGNEHKYLPVLAYAGAIATTYSRMHDEVHWASDLLVGNLIGYLVTKTLYNYYKNEKHNGGFEILPTVNPLNASFAVYFRWSQKISDRPCETAGLSIDQQIEKCLSKAFR